ncbi:hypothetical protein BDV38DRAFT_246336 [Aspergillus pseudotamarii]|uniref:Uncharacterized protein n=1 Tax=Aspergillus pseudotamarii TaxID=132259 RepID=A0A5N6SSE1_ASPPS|nr:uncharacterized protein BDV38DRAFT_246336 [Aspergillus pseudotamarii]KAE8137545.1 hypothetical protein BDV38DRAFT_246336 [Aspergillus pseudotamarii]
MWYLPCHKPWLCSLGFIPHEWSFLCFMTRKPFYIMFPLMYLYATGKSFDGKTAPHRRFTMNDHSFVRSWSFLGVEPFRLSTHLPPA